MSTLIFDLECDNLYDKVTTIWGMGYRWTTWENSYWTRDPDEIREILTSAEVLVGHNIIGYDLPVLKKLLNWEPAPHQVIKDTLVYSRLIYTDLGSKDKVAKKYHLEGKLKGSHSLAAWGIRMGLEKGEAPSFDVWDDSMVEYCIRDVDVTTKLFQHMEAQGYSKEALDLEHAFATIIEEQIRTGVAFNVKEAGALYLRLHQDKKELTDALNARFAGWYKPDGVFTPKRDNRTRGYRAGMEFTRIKWVPFNPGSNQHVAYVLKREYGWKPTQFTPCGDIKVSEEVLGSLKYPEAKLFYDYSVVNKLLGFLGDGDQSWLKNEVNGRLHGYVNPNGAVTGRCTHSKPNLANVPSSRAKWGKECRALFTVSKPQHWLLGFDASGLELRCLAGYLAYYDEGAYAHAVCEGNKEDGTDTHTVQAKILGCDRDTEKTWFYGFIYGAQDPKLGSILGGTRQQGKESRLRIQSKVPGLGKLVTKVHEASDRGYLTGIDGRKIKVRSKHASLNSLLQGCGAAIMKRFLVILKARLTNAGYVSGTDYWIVLNIHDEIQVETKNKAMAEFIGHHCKQAIKEAGEYYDFKCPIDGEFSIGKNWSETH